jgi:hypothetical protein
LDYQGFLALFGVGFYFVALIDEIGELLLFRPSKNTNLAFPFEGRNSQVD